MGAIIDLQNPHCLVKLIQIAVEVCEGHALGTVSKALNLLDILKSSDTQIGLSEISRQSGFDKATTRRLLLELMANGFVEQDPIDKYYVLGPTLQILGKAREERFPLYRTLLPIVKSLAQFTGETVHASEYAAGVLMTIHTQESEKSNRVSLAVGQKLPLHATASGLAFLAASPITFVDSFLRRPRVSFTAHTPQDVEPLLTLITQTKRRGYALSNQLLEVGIHSVASAFLDSRGKPIGTIAVAMPSIRADGKKIESCGKAVAAAALDISTKMFGRSTALRKAS